MSEFCPESAIILTGGIKQDPEGEYIPTGFEDSDQFGMLGGDIRVTAAVSLYLKGQTQNFMFVGGKSVKAGDLEKFDAPTPADVYVTRFFSQLGDLATASQVCLPKRDPHVVPNELPSNTSASLELLPDIMKDEEFCNPAIITSRYHIPRTEALLRQLLPDNKKMQKIEFLSAEEIVKANHPGLFDCEIVDAYLSEEGAKRVHNEEQGLRDMQQGEYQYGENLRFMPGA